MPNNRFYVPPQDLEYDYVKQIQVCSIMLFLSFGDSLNKYY